MLAGGRRTPRPAGRWRHPVLAAGASLPAGAGAPVVPPGQPAVLHPCRRHRRQGARPRQPAGPVDHRVGRERPCLHLADEATLLRRRLGARPARLGSVGCGNRSPRRPGRTGHGSEHRDVRLGTAGHGRAGGPGSPGTTGLRTDVLAGQPPGGPFALVRWRVQAAGMGGRAGDPVSSHAGRSTGELVRDRRGLRAVEPHRSLRFRGHGQHLATVCSEPRTADSALAAGTGCMFGSRAWPDDCHAPPDEHHPRPQGRQPMVFAR